MLYDDNFEPAVTEKESSPQYTTKVIWTCLLVCLGIVLINLFELFVSIPTGNQAATAQFTEDTNVLIMGWHNIKNHIEVLVWAFISLLILQIWRKELMRMFSLILLVAFTTLFSFGCKPYDTPKFMTIDTTHAAFLIPLDQDTKGGQVQFDSEQYLAEHKVVAKRIQIPRRWVQTGRFYWQGQWVDSMRLIVVDRSPVTRELTAESTSGTSKRDQAIWTESRDSVGFSVGITVTATVQDPNSSRFLYNYRHGSLAQVMDSEIRGDIQSLLSDFAGQHDLKDLRGLKKEMMSDVRQKVTDRFGAKGITITNIGMFGGFTYEDKEIQKGINDVFVAQQGEEAAKAQARAEETRADGVAKAMLKKAEAEALAIEMLNQAAAKAQENPMFLKLKELEVRQAQITKWDGTMPRMITGGGDSQLLLSVGSDIK